jgi:superoxide oxidase
LPAVIGRDRALEGPLLEIHENVGRVFLVLIALHIAAALFHHYWRRDDTLRSMLPLVGERRTTDPAT